MQREMLQPAKRFKASAKYLDKYFEIKGLWNTILIKYYVSKEKKITPVNN